MGKKKINLLDRPLTIEAVYEARPRLWWLYTLIVLIVVALLGWSGTTVEWEGFATKGIEVAKGVGNGLLHQARQLFPRSAFAAGDRHRLISQIAGESFDHSLDHIILGREVIIEQSLGHIHSRNNLRHRRLYKSLLHKQL